jgi:ADP-heptose:LPS heptosyltransferase
MNELDVIIPPEICGDEFYEVIKKLAAEANIHTILEIGSSAGGGSTEAFVSGIRDNKHQPRLFCMEVSKPRFTQLQQRYSSESFVTCYNVSSVLLTLFPSEKEIELFYRWIPSGLNNFSLERVLGCLQQDREYVASAGVPQNGIQIIKREHGITTFDMVLIDGSEFTGMAELDQVYGAHYLLLNDINGFKNRNNYQRLKQDPSYSLIKENWSVRNGYAVFQKVMSELPVHFFTIVLNGEPFIRYHIDVFKELPFRWHWHIVEGVAGLLHDTAWSVAHGGSITDELHDHGLSNDGTSAYLDWLVTHFPENVTIYRKRDGAFWDGKLEMVMAPLPYITEECLLWQVDADELWTTKQLIIGRTMFIDNPLKTAAFYTCIFFVGPCLITVNRNCYGNHTGCEWLRTWRYRPEDLWLSHEPPQLCRKNEASGWLNIAAQNSFSNEMTEMAGLIFQHYAYASESQIRFKETYYGYAGAAERWLQLQTSSDFPVLLSDYFAWVHDGAYVDTAESCGIAPLLEVNRTLPRCTGTATWQRILIIRTDTIGDNVLFMPTLPHIREKYPTAKIIICCQDTVAELYEASPFVDGILPFNHYLAYIDEHYRERIVQQLQNVRADLAINAAFTRQLLNEYFTLVSGASEKVAFYGDLCELRQVTRDADNQLYTRLIASTGENKPELERNRDLLGGLGIAAPVLAPVIWSLPDDVRIAEQFFIDQHLDPTKTIALFVTGRHTEKQYPHYPEALGRICREQGYALVAFGAGHDREVSAQALDIPGVRSVNLCGDLSLRQSAEIIRRCRVAVGADTGLSHIAGAVGTPHVVVLWGGHFGRFFPYSPLTTVVCLPLECYGCNWKCPYSCWHCVKDINPRILELAVTETLERIFDIPLVVCQPVSLWETPLMGPAWKSCKELIDGSKIRYLSVNLSDCMEVFLKNQSDYNKC